MGAGRAYLDVEWVLHHYKHSYRDGSYIRCHQHASGARAGFDKPIGQGHGGRTTKIHL